MSSQRGNVKRTRGQKYQNKSAFQNSLHDTSRKTKEMNKLEILEVSLYAFYFLFITHLDKVSI